MRILRAAIALFLSGALLVACSKVPTRETKPNEVIPPPAAATVSTIRVMINGGSEVDALISAYYNKYPNDRVEKVDPFASSGGGSVDMTDLIKEKIESGEVDVVAYLSTDLIKEGKVVPLDPFIQKSNFDLAPFGTSLESLRYEGKHYQLPYMVHPSMLMYNKEMFQAAGVTPPAEGWTWDDLRAIAQKLTQGEGDQKIWGFSPQFADNIVSMYFSQAGADIRQAYQDEQLVKDAFQLFGTMVQVDQSMPQAPRRNMEDNGPINSNEDFAQGKAAMTIMNVSSLRYMFGGRESFTVDVAPLPIRPGGKMVSRAYPQSFGIAANSPNQEAAWRFLSFVTGPEGAAILAKSGSVPVYNTPEVKAAWFERQPAPPPGTEVLFETTWDFGTSSGSVTPPSQEEMERLRQIFTALYGNLNAVMAAEKSWEDGFAEYQQALKEWQASKED